MKFTFSILAFIFTASIAQAMELHKVASNETGCQLVLPMAYKAGDVTWYGSCPGNIANGKGQIRLSRMADVCDAYIENGKISGPMECKAGDGIYITRFVEGVPLRSWYSEGSDEYIVQIKADGALTNNVITEDQAADFALKNSPQQSEELKPSDKPLPLESIPKSCEQTYTSYGLGVDRLYPQPTPLLGFVQNALDGEVPSMLLAKYSAKDFEKVLDLLKLSGDDWLELSKINDLKILIAIDGISTNPSFRDNPLAQEGMERGHDSLQKVISCWKSVATKKKAFTPVKVKEVVNQYPNASKPFTNRDCIDFKQYATDKITDSFKILHNRCGSQVQVLFCMYENREKERSTCDTLGEGLKGWGLLTVAKNADQWTADVVGTTWLVKYVVCEERDGCKFPRKGDNLYPTTKSSLGY